MMQTSFESTTSLNDRVVVGDSVSMVESEPLTATRHFVAYATLFCIFSAALVNVFWIPIVLWFFSWPIIALIISPLFIHHKPWRFIMDSYVLSTWRSYFSLKVIKTEPLPERGLFVVLPHGLFPIGLVSL